MRVYKRSDDTEVGVCLSSDVGGIGKKYGEVRRLRNEFIKEHGKACDIWCVDGSQKE